MKIFHLKYFQDVPGRGGVLSGTAVVLHPAVGEGVGALVPVVVPVAAVGVGEVVEVAVGAGGTPGCNEKDGEVSSYCDEGWSQGRFKKYLLCKLVDFSINGWVGSQESTKLKEVIFSIQFFLFLCFPVLKFCQFCPLRPRWVGGVKV